MYCAIFCLRCGFDDNFLVNLLHHVIFPFGTGVVWVIHTGFWGISSVVSLWSCGLFVCRMAQALGDKKERRRNDSCGCGPPIYAVSAEWLAESFGFPAITSAAPQVPC